MALPRAQRHIGDRPTREVIDADGRSWVLGEVPSISLDGTVHMALVAENGDLMRRLATYPENWTDLPDHVLISLVHARPVAAGGVKTTPDAGVTLEQQSVQRR